MHTHTQTHTLSPGERAVTQRHSDGAGHGEERGSGAAAREDGDKEVMEVDGGKEVLEVDGFSVGDSVEALFKNGFW